MKTLTAMVGSSFRRACWLGIMGALLSVQNIHAEPALGQVAGIDGQGDDLAASASVSADAPAQLVSKIEVRPDGDDVTVLVKGDGRLFYSARLLNDNRLVVDLVSVTSALKSPLVQGQHHLLKKVRVGYHPDKVRLVLDLLERPVFSVTTVGSDLLVSLKPRMSESGIAVNSAGLVNRKSSVDAYSTEIGRASCRERV